MAIKFCSSVLLVKDVNVSRNFYEGLLGQEIEFDHGACVAFGGGFSIWQKEYAHSIMKVQHYGHTANRQTPCFELYFEADDLDNILKKLSDKKIELVHETYEQPWGQRVFRVFDPDGHIVEIGEPMTAVVKRCLKSGLEPEEVAKRTSMPVDFVIKQAEDLK